MIQLNQIRIPFEADDACIRKKIAVVSHIPEEKIHSYRIVRRSLDARKKEEISFLINVAVEAENALEKKAVQRSKGNISFLKQNRVETLEPGSEPLKGRVVVVGMGPAGLFAGYMLAKYGYKPFIIERGKPITERIKDVETFWEHSVLNPECNVMFGEGGAGTFSDGKLTSRSKDPRGEMVLRLLYENGAPEEILYLAKPHIGTDVLREVVQNIRKSILSLGGEIVFSTKLEKIAVKGGTLKEIEVLSETGRKRIETGCLVLAIGQGARDTYRMLFQAGTAMAPKSFALGCRIEHPQELIDKAQFGIHAGNPILGPAEYRLTARSDNRGVYTFCMCPGGYVVASSSSTGQVVVNGMSNHKRDAVNANAAVIVQVNPEDFGSNPLDGVEFCEQLEQKAYLCGGSDYRAPASRVEDFLNRQKSNAFGNVMPSYKPGVTPTNLWDCLPDYIAKGIADGLHSFSTQLVGYDLPDAVLTAVETRTSSPVRILRSENGESITTRGVYPVGEGAGYAGGIVSAAIDGMKAAETIIQKYKNVH